MCRRPPELLLPRGRYLLGLRVASGGIALLLVVLVPLLLVLVVLVPLLLVLLVLLRRGLAVGRGGLLGRLAVGRGRGLPIGRRRSLLLAVALLLAIAPLLSVRGVLLVVATTIATSV